MEETQDTEVQNEEVKGEIKASRDGSICGFDSLHRLLKENLKPQHFQSLQEGIALARISKIGDLPPEVNRLLLGLNCGRALDPITLTESATDLSVEHGFDLQAFSFQSDKEVLREPRVVRVGLIQNSIASPTTAPFLDQKRAIFNKLKPIIDAADASGVNVLCLQEAWMMPFAFCTREKRWCEFAETVDGVSTQFLQSFALKYNMVIISPILERDINHGEVLWNTAIVIGNHGYVIGKHRKAPSFELLAFGLNGAEIVFNPSATVGELSEPMWPMEARNAAIANSYFVASINRVGTETFLNPFTSGDGKPAHANFGHFYGSSHVSAPDASCTPSLSRNRDCLIIADMDLNLCRQLKDKWGFRMTARYDLYAETLINYLKPNFEPQVISDPLLHKKSSN